MELKNAAAVCLISLFSATLVVLIARSLDNQAAARLEPQLENIAKELRSLRGQGFAAASGDSTDADALDNGLIVYYFHGSVRCPTCRSIETQAEEAVRKHYAAQLNDGKMVWKIVNFEGASGKPLAEKFQVQSPIVVLAEMKNGTMGDWKRLDEVWALVGDPPAFEKFLREQIDKMLPQAEKAEAAADPVPAIPVP